MLLLWEALVWAVLHEQIRNYWGLNVQLGKTVGGNLPEQRRKPRRVCRFVSKLLPSEERKNFPQKNVGLFPGGGGVAAPATSLEISRPSATIAG